MQYHLEKRKTQCKRVTKNENRDKLPDHCNPIKNIFRIIGNETK